LAGNDVGYSSPAEFAGELRAVQEWYSVVRPSRGNAVALEAGFRLVNGGDEDEDAEIGQLAEVRCLSSHPLDLDAYVRAKETMWR
jgi:hypothetical protein